MNQIGDEHNLSHTVGSDSLKFEGAEQPLEEQKMPLARKGGVFIQAHDFFVGHPYMSLMIAMVEIQIGFINAFDIFGQDNFIDNSRGQAWGLAAAAWLLTVYLLFCAIQGLRKK